MKLFPVLAKWAFSPQSATVGKHAPHTWLSATNQSPSRLVSKEPNVGHCQGRVFKDP